MNILRVALDIPLPGLFDYNGGDSRAAIGQRVLAPFGSRQVIGIVIERASSTEVSEGRLKSIVHAFENEAPISASALKLIRFCADYYQYPFGQALLSALPSRLREARPVQMPTKTVYKLTEQGQALDVEQLPKNAAVRKKLITALQQAEHLDAAAIQPIAKTWRNVIKLLMENGLVTTHEIEPGTLTGSPIAANELPLNPSQQAALQAILDNGRTFQVFLLHGITGSGKTEVYMQLLRSVLQQPRAQALVLVPEINLTPQLEARFRARFPQLPMVMLHSKMNESERLHGWLAAQSGEARIVIGTRLSVFTPLPHLALIVVDEEHDASYKQQDGMRYSARDVAVMRGKMANVPVLLGSATPSLETWYNAQSGRYRLLEIHQRAVAGAELPRISCLDVRGLPVDQAFSPQVIAALRARMQRGEQSLLFLNRRGYSPVLLCSSCNWVVPCKRCSSRLVVHKRDRLLRCHHCGYEQRFPQECPECGNPDLRPVGQGTQRLEEVLAQQLPEARILRVDSDSMRRKHAVAEMSQQVHDGEVDILVGTQMLAKGHDFPNLTLVVVVDADSALFSPDFRAAERLFAQLMQVAGRAGRAGKAGEVVIQTAFPDHVLFHALQSHDYPAFAQTLLQDRKLAHFPPYCFEALLRAEATSWEQVQAFMRGAAASAGTIPHQLTVYDPVRPRMERLKGLERAQLLVQAGTRQALQKFLQAWVAELRTLPQSAKVRWSVDVDPLEY